MRGVCLSVSLSPPPPPLRLLSASAPGRQGKHVTLTGIKQDTALRQAQMWAGTSYFSVTPAASFLPVASLPGPASISLCVSLPALSQEGARKTEMRAVLPPSGWFVHCPGCGGCERMECRLERISLAFADHGHYPRTGWNQPVLPVPSQLM